MEYTKTVKSTPDIIMMLQDRGLKFLNVSNAEEFFRRVSYFRVAAYLRPLEQDKVTHTYKQGSNFESAITLYEFDSSLRVLVFSCIQTIEVALRTSMIQSFTEKYGPFWFSDERLANNKIKKQIAKSFSIPQHEVLESWMRSIGGLRNCCAHHNRIWNRNLSDMPQIPRVMKCPWLSNFNFSPFRLYAALACMTYWLNAIQPSNTFIKDFKKLLSTNSGVDIVAMGFPQGWEDEPLWKE